MKRASEVHFGRNDTQRVTLSYHKSPKQRIRRMKATKMDWIAKRLLRRSWSFEIKLKGFKFEQLGMVGGKP